jgi:hypothetical protein
MFSSQERLDIEGAAEQLGIKARCMIALGLTESSGTVYWMVQGARVPPIRPEVHKFYEFLKPFPDLQRKAVNEGLAHPKRNGVTLPKSYAGRWQFFDRMTKIHSEAAYAATSWGWGQVMGFHWEKLGYESAEEVAMTASSGVAGQTELVARYLDRFGVTPYLNDLPNRTAAEKVALAYNGPKWRENDYAKKLIQNWAIAENGQQPAGRSIHELQESLTILGYEPGKVDGVNGPATKAALKAYQTANGLVADGIAGPMTWEELDKDLLEKAQEKARTRKDTVGTAGIGVGAVAVVGEAVRQADEIRTVAEGLFDGLSLPDYILPTALALLVLYILYDKLWKR